MTKNQTAAEKAADRAYNARKQELKDSAAAADKKIADDSELEIDDSFPVVNGADPSEDFKPLNTVATGQNVDSRLRDVIEGMMSTDNMEVRSVLESKHEIALVRIAMFAKKFDSKLARFLYETLLQIRVSHDGRGRKDMVAAMKAAVTQSDDNSTGEDERRRMRLFH